MRKLNALFIAAIIILSIGMLPLVTKQVYGATDKAKQVINALGIMNTDKGSNSDGTVQVSRARFAQMLVNLSLQKEITSKVSNVSLFKDVSKKHWAGGYIQTAITKGWMSGFLNGTFKPDRGITLQEAVKAVVQLLGYSNSDFLGNLIGGQMALYVSKDLDKNIYRSRTSILTTNDCINLFYNTLKAITKDGKIYAETLGYKMNSNGELDYFSIVNADTKGPVIVDEDWTAEIPFSTADATYYKSGKKSSIAEIDDYDVVYYSKSLQTIWVYDDKVTGTVTSINPNQITPESVTVSGRDYTLATSNMNTEFSSMGTVGVGDVITLLLGKDNTVVGVLNIDEYNTSITGVVLEIGQHLIEDENDGFTSSKYVVFVDSAGNEYQQDYDETKVFLTVGNLVRVTYEDGKASVSNYNLDGIALGNNTFNSEGNMLGNVKLASNIKILDLLDQQYITVYPERLAGVNVSSSVFYYKLNDNGELSQLILKDITGDMNKYGIFTGYNLQTGKAYEYLIDGVKGILSNPSPWNFDNEIGPKGYTTDGKDLTASFKISEGTILSLGKSTVQVADLKISLAEGYDVYYFKNGEYIMTTIDKVSDLSKYNLTAYYDGEISTGGRVRIIVANSKS